MRRQRIAAAMEALRGSDPARASSALDALVELGGADAGKAIAQRLDEGLPPALIERAIVALVVTHPRGAERSLLSLMQHRRPRIRAAAVTGLGDARARKARSVATASLRDPAKSVRVAAAQALGALGSPLALSALLTAYDGGLTEALPAIGQVANARYVGPLFERVQGGYVTPLEPALDRMMERPRFGVTGKLKIIRSMADVASPTARAFLMRWLDAWKVDGDARLKKALFAGLKKIDDTQKEESRKAREARDAAGAKQAQPAAPEPTSRATPRRHRAKGGRS